MKILVACEYSGIVRDAFAAKGHDVSKKTCLWLKNLPNLKPTKIVKPDIIERNGYKMSRHHWETFKLPSKIRGKVRSRFYEGIANAMADQWGTNG
jgi:hypothetical protein